MLPTFETGTINRNTQCPGHPGHFSTAGLMVVASEGFTADGSAAVAKLVGAWVFAEPFSAASTISMGGLLARAGGTGSFERFRFRLARKTA